ncbi:MAG: SDR family oxidoreductase [Cytophagales bacterium]|nr:SDR family oxidoreductase [Cytophagales bacterium]
MSLQGKVIWLTGASSGIGEALAYALARQKVKLILSSRRKEELERVKGNCHPLAQPDIRLLPFDLAEGSTLQLIAEAAVHLFGHVDILINNGGISQRSLAKNTLVSVDRRIMEVDYFGTIAISKYLLPHFIKRKSGHFVVITSAVGIIGTPYRTGYAAAKHALHGFFDSLRAELWKEGKSLYVTMICPGFVRTNVSMNALLGDGTKLNQMDPTTQDGLDPKGVAKRIIRAIEQKRNEVYIGGFMSVLGIYMKRFFPGIFARIVRTAKVR